MTSNNTSGKPISVLISVPCPPYGNVTGALADFLVCILAKGWKGMVVKYDRVEDKWPAVRNLQIKRFLELFDCDYLLIIDSDIIPPSNILEMVENKVDFCSAVCFSWHFEEPFALVLTKDPKGRDGYIQNVPKGKAGLYERDVIGLACAVISRKLAEEFKSTFQDKLDDEGMFLRDADFDFCERIKKAGYKVWVDTRFICDHRKTIGLKRVNDLLVRRK